MAYTNINGRQGHTNCQKLKGAWGLIERILSCSLSYKKRRFFFTQYLSFFIRLLKESLYGLKQSPKQWYRRFDEFMMTNGYRRSKYDSCVYLGGLDQSGVVCLLLYVDDMLIASKYKTKVDKLKNLLKDEFAIFECLRFWCFSFSVLDSFLDLSLIICSQISTQHFHHL